MEGNSPIGIGMKLGSRMVPASNVLVGEGGWSGGLWGRCAEVVWWSLGRDSSSPPPLLIPLKHMLPPMASKHFA